MTKPTDQPCCGPDCCGGTATQVSAAGAGDDAGRQQVREGYARIARGGSWPAAQGAAPTSGCRGSTATPPGGGCCGPAAFSPDQLAAAIGYAQSELAAV